VRAQGESRLETLFPSAADEFFRALRLSCDGIVELDEPSFAVVVVTRGSGRLLWSGGERAISSGDTLVVPWAAGTLSFAGSLSALICLPPAV
jgi:mannose-6-phosphate isomerase